MQQGRKTILIFSLAFDPYFGGAEIAIQEICKRLPNFDFHIVTLRFNSLSSKLETKNNITIHRIGRGKKNPDSKTLKNSYFFKLNKIFFPFFSFFTALKLHRRYKYDLIWAMMANYAGFGALFFKKRNKRIPFLLTLQEGDPIDYIKKRVRFVYPWFKQIFIQADYVQVISKYLADFAKSMGFKGKPVVIPNAVDVEYFATSVSDPDLENRFKKNNNDKLLITTSRLVRKNAVDDIIKAMVFLDAGVKFLILGDGEEKDYLKSLVQKLKLKERVFFLGNVKYENIPQYLKIADIFIRPSRSEGMGNSFIEAMASGIPVIATPVGGIVDFLFDGKTGIFCRVDNPNDIAEKVKLILKNQNLRNEIVKNAFELVKNKYDWNIIAHDMDGLFQKIFI